VLLLGINWLLARHQFEPIDRFLKGEATFESAERRLTQLPLLTARWVGIFALVLYAFRNSLSWWLPEGPTIGLGAQNHRRLHRRLPAAAHLLFHLYLFRRERLPRPTLQLHLRTLPAQSRAVFRQLHAEAGRGAAGDLRGAARRHRSSTCSRTTASASGSRFWSMSPPA